MKLKKLSKKELKFITNESIMDTILDDNFETFFYNCSLFYYDNYKKNENLINNKEEYFKIKKNIDDFLNIKNINLPKTEIFNLDKLIEKQKKTKNISDYLLLSNAAIFSYSTPLLSAFLLGEYFILKKFIKNNNQIVNTSHYDPFYKKINLLEGQNTNETFAHEYAHHISSKILPLIKNKNYNFFNEGFSQYIGRFELDALNFKSFMDIIEPTKLRIYKKYRNTGDNFNKEEKLKLFFSQPVYDCGLLFFRLFHQICGEEVTKNLLIKPSESFKELNNQIKYFNFETIKDNCNSSTNLYFFEDKKRKNN